MKYKLIQFAFITLFVLSAKSYPQANPLNVSSRVICLQSVILEGSLLPCHGIMLNSLIATTPDCAKKVAHITSSSKATIDVAVYGYSAHHDLIEQIDSTYELSSDRTDRGILGLSQIPLSYQAAAILFDASGLIERTRGGTRSNQIISDVTAYYIALDSHSSEQLISHNFSLKYVDFSALKWEAASAKEKMIFQKLPPGTALTKDNKVVCLVDSDGKHCTYPHLFSRVKRTTTPVFDKTNSALQGKCLGKNLSYTSPFIEDPTAARVTEAPIGIFGSADFFDVGECASGTNTICRFSIDVVNVQNYTATYQCSGICDATGTSSDFDRLLDDAIECLCMLEPTSPVITTSEEPTSTQTATLVFDRTSRALQGECEVKNFNYTAPLLIEDPTAERPTGAPIDGVYSQFFNMGECASGTSTMCRFSINVINVQTYTATYRCSGICNATSTSNDFERLLDEAIECLYMLESTNPVTTTSEELTSISTEELTNTNSGELRSTTSLKSFVALFVVLTQLSYLY